MTMDPRQSQYLRAKKGEEDHYPQINPTVTDDKFPKLTCTKQWSNYKNPRIVRASRAFGGKDRHSKVCTVKGLRDRRIRLSAPTSIQLYDLQYRLGLNQPSKVVDWLLEAAKEEIDKLPPLPMIPQFCQPNDPLLIPSSVHDQSLLYNKDLHVDHNVIKSNQDRGFGGFQVSNNLFPLGNYQGNLPQYNVQSWDRHCPNLTLSQYGGEFSLSSSQIIAGDYQLNTHINMANAVMVPSFPSYNMITAAMENNNNVMPATLRWISNSSMSSTLGLNVNCRSVTSQVNDSDKK